MCAMDALPDVPLDQGDPTIKDDFEAVTAVWEILLCKL